MANRIGDPLDQPLPEAIELRRHAGACLRQRLCTGPRRGPEAGERGDRLRARPQLALLRAAGEEWPQAGGPTTDPQGAHARRTAELVTRQGEEVDAELADVDRQPSGGLRGVGMEQDAATTERIGQARERRHAADLAI